MRAACNAHLRVLNCLRWRGYLLLGLISSFVFRAVRDALPNNPAAQERILGASFTALALADVRVLTSSDFVRLIVNTFVGHSVRPAAMHHAAHYTDARAHLSIIWSWVGLPDDLKYSPLAWNSMTHGNISFVVVLLAGR